MPPSGAHAGSVEGYPGQPSPETYPRRDAKGLLGELIEAIRSPWVLGLIVSILTWNAPAFGQLFGVALSGDDSLRSIFYSPDPSWMWALGTATHQHLQFGSELIFTFGPLGFLDFPTVTYLDQFRFALLFYGVLHLLLCVVIVWSVRHSTGSALAGAIVALLVATFASVEFALPVALMFMVAAIALRPDAPKWSIRALIAGGALLSAFELLIKINTGVTVLAICLIAIAGLSIPRARAYAVFLGTSVAALLVLWTAAGQDLSGIWNYFVASFHVVSGYPDAMAGGSADIQRWQIATVLIAAAALVTAALRFSRDWPQRATIAVALITMLTLFSAFKAGFVRHDLHALHFFTLVVVMLAAFDWSGRRRQLVAVPLLIGGLVAVGLAANTSAVSFVRVDQRIGDARDQLHLALRPSMQREIVDRDRAAARVKSGIDPKLAAAVGDRTVFVWPEEAVVAPAFGLNWKPMPTVQAYAAYDSWLDRKNAEFFNSSDAPQMILAGPTDAGDGKYPAYQSPAASVAMLCNYEQVRASGEWRLLQRVADRCGAPHAVGTASANWNQWVEVPNAGRNEILVAKVKGTAPGVAEFAPKLALRPEKRGIMFGYGALLHGKPEFSDGPYRIVPSTAENGLVLQAPKSIERNAQFRIAPGAGSIRLLTKGPSSSKRLIKIQFVAVPVETTKP